MRDNAKEMDALTKDKAANAETMNSVEHMKLHSQITETHLAQLKKLIPPFEAFYNSQSDETEKDYWYVIQDREYEKTPQEEIIGSMIQLKNDAKQAIEDDPR